MRNKSTNNKKENYLIKPKKEVKRPWGKFKEFTKNKKSTVKILEVLPGEELSLQKHLKREEEWHFLTPGQVEIGKVELDRKNKIKNKNTKTFSVKKNETIKIPKSTAHRIIAPNSLKEPVRFLEISLGKFNEKDEIRLEDKYDR